MTDQQYQTPQQELRDVHSQIAELDKNPILDKDQERRMAELMTRSQGLRAQIDLRKGAAAELEAGAQSSGMLPLAAGNGGVPPAAQLQSMRSAGTTVIEHGDPRRDGRQSVRIAEQFGEGLPTDSKTWAAISSPEYKEAFRSYIRSPMSGAISPAAIRTLQEGADPSGGLAV